MINMTDANERRAVLCIVLLCADVVWSSYERQLTDDQKATLTKMIMFRPVALYRYKLRAEFDLNNIVDKTAEKIYNLYLKWYEVTQERNTLEFGDWYIQKKIGEFPRKTDFWKNFNLPCV